MRNFFRKRIAANTMLKMGSLNTVGIAVRVVCALITSKLVAVYVGAAGMAILGDLRNFMSSLQSIGQLGISNGIIKYTAEYKNEPYKLRKLISTSVKIPVLASVGLGAVLVLGASMLNTLIFDKNLDYSWIIRLAGLALPIFTLQTVLLHIINGLGAYKKVIYINMTIHAVGVLLTTFLIINYKLWGAMLALVVFGLLALVITVFFLKSQLHKALEILRIKVDRSLLKKLGSYSLMTVFSAITAPLVYIAIRQYIIKVDGIENAGYWDAMLRLSDYYLMFATTILTLYVLPKLSAGKNKPVLRPVVIDFYKTILPLFGLGVVAIFFLKTWIIQLVYDRSFLEMQPIFFWQLAGDFVRVASLVIAYQIIAQNMVKTFIATQILSLAIIYFSSVWLVSQFGFVGAGMAHLLSYSAYLLVLVVLFRNSLFPRKP